MADNTLLSSPVGVGDTIATDDDGTAKHQWVKVEFGGDGTFTPVTSSVGLPADILDRAARDCGKVDIANLDTLPTFDMDSGAGTQNLQAIGLAVAASGGAVQITGDAGNGLDVDVTRVSGTVTIADTNLDNATLVDNAAFTDGTTRLVMMGHIYDDTAGTALTENDAAAARVSANRATVCAIEDGSTRARYATVTASNALKVDGSAVTQPISDTNLDNATLVDNAAFTDGTTRLMMAGYILDDTAGTALTENDAAAPRISTNRATVCAIEDGATRARYATVTASNALKVDGSAVTQPVSISGNQAVNVAQLAGTTTDTNSGNKSAGTLRVVIATDQPQLTNKLLVTPDADSAVVVHPVTSGGCSISHLVSAASTNATNAKASAGQVYGWSIFNTNASTRYVKLHNTAGTPTAGSGVVYTIGVPANGGSNIDLATGLAFGTGIAFTTVTGAADSDSTAVGANDLIINLHYK